MLFPRQTLQENAQRLQIRPEGFEGVLCSIGFKPAQRLGEPGEGRECLDIPQWLIVVVVFNENVSGFRRPVDLYVKSS